MREENYIRYRKLKALGNSLVFHMMRIFPIDNKLINVCTFEGKGGFGCNPKYVVEELHRQHPELKFVWMVNDSSWDKEFPDYIKKVRNSSLISRAYWLSRAKVWIDNYRKPLGTCKRKGQYYLNVNHFTVGIKCTGLHRGSSFSKMAYLVNKNDSDMIDDLVIDSEWCASCFKDAMVYDGNLLKTGSPRCDVLYGDRSEQKRKFRQKHNLPKNAKVLMFAPTFREGSKNGVRSVYSEVWSLDFRRLLETLEKKTGGIWYICLRVHPQLAPTFKGLEKSDISNRILDESQADDMYEILAGMDAYITDYSSALFEAGFAGIPSFVYADDIQKYAHDRGSLMWNLATDLKDHITNNKEVTPKFDLEFPFQIATDNEEMGKLIIDFDIYEYDRKLTEFKNHIRLIFDGKASERIVKHVLDMVNPLDG